MRRGLALQTAGALTLLVSLYLPWQQTSFVGPDVDGWQSGVGDAAALAAVAVVAAAAVAWVRPALLSRIPLGLCALAAGFFAVAVGAAARSTAHHQSSLPFAMNASTYHFAYGTYVGLAAAAVTLLGAAMLRRRELTQPGPVSELATIALVAALLVSFLLPWERVEPGTLLAIGTRPAAAVAAVLALCLVRLPRLEIAAAVCLFTSAAFSSLSFPESHAYGAWIGLGVAIALVALTFFRSGVPSVAAPGWGAIATGGAVALLVVALFLPWQKACYGNASDFGPYAGRCVSTNGWTSHLGVAAGLLAVGLLVVTAVAWRTVLVAGVALLVATFGFQLQHGRTAGFRLELGYGALIGFVAAGLLVALVLADLRAPRVAWYAVRLVPIAACLVYLAVVVVPWWDVLPRGLQRHLAFTVPSWVTIAGVVLALWLLRLWIWRNHSVEAGALFAVPIALLWLAMLDLIRLRDNGLNWGEGIVVALTLVLALLGRVEQRDGLEGFRVPELLRVDRL